MATLSTMASIAQPTTFHHLLKALDNRGTLLRVYTQNIDGLERKVGLHVGPSQHSDKPAKCIPLHGTLEHVRCQGCHSIDTLQSHYDCLMSGSLPSCYVCQEEQRNRKLSGKRPHKVPTMVPDVLLYGQENGDGEYVGDIQMKDIRVTDLLVVVGTSLKVDGAKSTVKEFSKYLRRHHSRTGPALRAIYINTDLTAPKTWSRVFDAWVKADCQVVASAILDRMDSLTSISEDQSKVCLQAIFFSI